MNTNNELPKNQVDSIRKYWDGKEKAMIAKLLPGDVYVTAKKELISTLLGSCVSACIRDVTLNIGGMNHFLLPVQKPTDFNSSSSIIAKANRYGNWAMENLVNEILKLGGTRFNLEVKIFGGSVMLNKISSNIGENNIRFIRHYLNLEKMQIASEDLGGEKARLIMYDPTTGVVKVKKVAENNNINQLQQAENSYIKSIESPPERNDDVELFD